MLGLPTQYDQSSDVGITQYDIESGSLQLPFFAIYFLESVNWNLIVVDACEHVFSGVRPPPGLEQKESTRFWKDAGPRKNSSSDSRPLFCQSQMLESFDISR